MYHPPTVTLKGKRYVILPLEDYEAMIAPKTTPGPAVEPVCLRLLLAAVLGVSPQLISQAETGALRMGDAFINRFLTACGAPHD